MARPFKSYYIPTTVTGVNSADPATRKLARMRDRLDRALARAARAARENDEAGMSPDLIRAKRRGIAMSISQMRRRIREHIARWGDPIVPKMVEGDL